MNYNQTKRKFKQDQLKSSLRLLKWTGINFHLISLLNNVDGIILKAMVIVLGFQYDIYMKLREVSWDNKYLAHAEMVRSQIEETIKAMEVK